MKHCGGLLLGITIGAGVGYLILQQSYQKKPPPFAKPANWESLTDEQKADYEVAVMPPAVKELMEKAVKNPDQINAIGNQMAKLGFYYSGLQLIKSEPAIRAMLEHGI